MLRQMNGAMGHGKSNEFVSQNYLICLGKNIFWQSLKKLLQGFKLVGRNFDGNHRLGKLKSINLSVRVAIALQLMPPLLHLLWSPPQCLRRCRMHQKHCLWMRLS